MVGIGLTDLTKTGRAAAPCPFSFYVPALLNILNLEFNPDVSPLYQFQILKSHWLMSFGMRQVQMHIMGEKT